MMDFSSGAGAAGPTDLIPAGQVAFAILLLRAVKSSASGGQYLDVELTIDEGQPYGRKKLWDMIGDPLFPGNSEAYRQMGMIAITRILEAGKGAGPNNPAGYKLDKYEQLTGLRVAIKIGIEKGTGGFADKNKVAEYLTPNPASQSGHKGFQRLMAGDFAPEGGAAKPAAAASGFGNVATGTAATNGFGGATTTMATTGGFGNGGVAAAGSGFPVASAADQQTQNGSATTTSATEASPSDPAATPSWLAQAG